jgi:hypothetical protein
MVRTTAPKVDMVDISSAEAPMAQALVARSGSKPPDDAPIDGNPDILNSTAAMSWIVGWTSLLP